MDSSCEVGWRWGLSPRLFSCNYICIDHLGAFEDVWVGVEADRRGPGKGGWGRGRGRGWQGVFAGGTDGRMSCIGSFLWSGRVPNDSAVLE